MWDQVREVWEVWPDCERPQGPWCRLGLLLSEMGALVGSGLRFPKDRSGHSLRMGLEWPNLSWEPTREAKGLNLCRGAVTVVDQGLQARKEDRGQEERMEGTGAQDYWRKSHWHLRYLGKGARHMPDEGRVAGPHYKLDLLPWR